MSGNLEKSGGALDANFAADPAVAAAPVVEPESGLNGTVSPPPAAAGADWPAGAGWLEELVGWEVPLPPPCAGAGFGAPAVAVAGGQGAVLAACCVFFLLKTEPRFLNASFAFCAA